MMKFTAEHYATIKLAVENHLTSNSLKLSDLKESLKAKSEQYFIWTVLWDFNIYVQFRELFDNYNDKHIETAMRSICKELIANE